MVQPGGTVVRRDMQATNLHGCSPDQLRRDPCESVAQGLIQNHDRN